MLGYWEVINIYNISVGKTEEMLPLPEYGVTLILI
jgi:hypothetical protein